MCYLSQNITRHPDLADYIASKFDEFYNNELKKPLSEFYVSSARLKNEIERHLVKFKSEQLEVINRLPHDIRDEVEHSLDGYILILLQEELNSDEYFFNEIKNAVQSTESLGEQQAHSGDDFMIYF
ncbi:MAG: hypothetical protein sL5_08340 [Candidatus Mesenet longicola]|uniref:Uncharacterized protein n=1 Tax=Candidatus Mesenet longicola TaxID=1892558 RepID=A0A8J3HQ78_9RICK|nr:MAG: hypothetical protein sGL2_06900 [Candidatus Mesenet longicola]GHM59841.1 MAG: hypothetical protein sL5_08340 [Candidatus Mesenet longicola]